MPRTARSGKPTTDHEEIRKWVEERGGKPAAVARPTRGDAGIIRIDFPGYSGKNLREISWDEWFKTFDKAGLAFLHRGDHFNKLVRRDNVDEEGSSKNGRKRSARKSTASSRRTPSRAKTTRSKAKSSKAKSSRAKSKR